MQARKPIVDLAALESEERRSPFRQRRSEEARRRVWRVVGVRLGLPRHDMEVEGVVVKDVTPHPLLHVVIMNFHCSASMGKP